MSRRSLQKEVDVSDVLETSSNFKIHGVISSLLLMKTTKTCSYFDGQITDGKSKMCLFGFDGTIRKRLANKEDDAVSISNCEVKKSRHGDQLEVLLEAA